MYNKKTFKMELPQLPLEIINKILYEFKGLEHPFAKIFKEVQQSFPKSLPEKPIDYTVEEYISKLFQIRVKQQIWSDKYFHVRQRRNRQRCDCCYSEYILNNLCKFFSEYTDYSINHINPLVKTGIIVNKYKRSRYVDTYRWINLKEYTKKDLQEYLEVNKIKFYKSWKKQKLFKAAMTF